jgi:hypothetical protein
VRLFQNSLKVPGLAFAHRCAVTHCFVVPQNSNESKMAKNNRTTPGAVPGTLKKRKRTCEGKSQVGEHKRMTYRGEGEEPALKEVQLEKRENKVLVINPAKVTTHIHTPTPHTYTPFASRTHSRLQKTTTREKS